MAFLGEADAADRMTELVFDKYKILRRVAIGGMGEIFLARQHGVAGFERLVILKALIQDLSQSETSVEQFLDEARTAATLNHPNIVSVLEVGAWRGRHFIAMEYIDGPSIASLLTQTSKNGVPIPPAVSCHIVRDAAAALHHAHSATTVDGQPLSIVHRDVSPHNIMLRRDGVTKVVDFGIAKAANRMSRTTTGMVKGKIPYLSPEQANGQPVDRRSDQFSLGTVFWELCTGKRLFYADSPAATLRRITDRPIPRLATIWHDCPTELDDIAMQMLERDPERRFADCGEVVDRIDAFLRANSESLGANSVAQFVQEHTKPIEPVAQGEDFLVDLGPGPESESKTEESPRPRRIRRGTILAMSLLVIAIVTAAGILRLNSSSEPPQVVTSPQLEQPAVPPEPRSLQPAPSQRLVVRSTPSGAQVQVNGEPIATTPAELDGLEADRPHEVRVELPDHEPYRFEALLKPGETRTYEIALKPVIVQVPSAPTPSTRKPRTEAAKKNGFLTIDTTPWSLVKLDNVLIGSTPIFRKSVPPGEHRLQFENPDLGLKGSRTIRVKPGEQVKVRLAL